MTDNETGPSNLLQVVHYGCKEPFRKFCSCRNAGLNCASTCKECHGITWTNTTIIDPKVDNDEMKETFGTSFSLFLDT